MVACVAVVSFPSMQEVNVKLGKHAKAKGTNVAKKKLGRGEG